MRIVLFLISALFFVSVARSQHHHFFYIQSDQQQLFYVKIGPEVMSSSAGGFLIIPKLKDSAFDMIIGFPKDQYPEYRFRIARVNKDKGLSLKNFAEKGWGLFDLQTLEITMGEKIIKVEVPKEAIPAPVTNDAFTAILATVIDDPGLMATQLVLKEPAASMTARNTIPVKENAQENQSIEKVVSPPPIVQPEKKSEVVVLEQATVKPPPEKSVTATKKSKSGKAGTVVAASGEKESKGTAEATEKVAIAQGASIFKQESGNDSIGVNVPGKNVSESPVFVAKIRKVSEVVHDSFMELVFMDHTETGQVDTIRVMLERALSPRALTVMPEPPVSTVVAPVAASQKTEPETKKDTAVAVPENTVPVSAAKEDITLMNSRKNTRAACNKLAVEKDVTGLRRRMVGLKDEDDMVTIALKDFKQKCFTTEQVKNVSFVFVRDEGRYKLLDAAYPYVYDPDNFTSLESLLSDPYFVHRFRALIKLPDTKLP